ncbi:MAG: hypothetical protein IT364_07320 [Candidatus Hydrogenedentes bacterium]|nr:hypothetical protein [Candidatus Hydrogenedentota bacterium]
MKGLALLVLCASALADDTITYNGIRQADPWPPVLPAVPTREPMPVPYLEAIPEVIPIDTGRQLFVDDFLIEPCTLTRTYHQAVYHPASPVLIPDKPWEMDTESQGFPAPTAMPFSDGVWFDPQDQLFKMWYMGGYVKATCYAQSRDGIHWEKPELDVVPGTNIVQTVGRDSNVVWLDHLDPDPARRFKMVVHELPNPEEVLSVYFSRDGIHWGERVTQTGPAGDRCTAFYNPFRGVWVYSVKDNYYDRRRRYQENADLIAGAPWVLRELPMWVGADRLDPIRPELNIFPQLYNLDAVAYESLMLGFFSIWYGQPEDRPKPNCVCLGFSRDGFHWYRPDRRPFIGVSEKPGDWNWGNVQSAGGGCLVVGDTLYFYVSGRTGVPGKNTKGSGTCATGLATLRRDGFVSMDASGDEQRLTTRMLQFSGKYLFVNVDAPQGELRVEVLDENREPIEPFTYKNCVPLRANSTLEQVHWTTGDDLSSLAGKPVRFRFHLRDGSLYAFWVSPEESGASHGYVAAGGPGYAGPVDTVGKGGLQ